MCVDVICEYKLPGIRLTIGCTRNSESFLETNVTRQVGRDKFNDMYGLLPPHFQLHNYYCSSYSSYISYQSGTAFVWDTMIFGW